jgi:hypothetical protein
VDPCGTPDSTRYEKKWFRNRNRRLSVGQIAMKPYIIQFNSFIKVLDNS